MRMLRHPPLCLGHMGRHLSSPDYTSLPEPIHSLQLQNHFGRTSCVRPVLAFAIPEFAHTSSGGGGEEKKKGFRTPS
jgi:hypothetical protein